MFLSSRCLNPASRVSAVAFNQFGTLSRKVEDYMPFSGIHTSVPPALPSAVARAPYVISGKMFVEEWQ